jgi:PAS domain S-box-containing protein
MDDHADEEKVLGILRGAVENTNEAFVTIDETHRVLFFNKAAERVFGCSRDEVIGQDLGVIMSPSCSDDHRMAVDRYVKTRVPRRIGHHTEINATRKTGETFPADISFSVSEANGKTYFTAIVRDLSETRKLQEKIKRSEQLAALGQFVAEITHEIKNPLMMIGGFVRQLTRVTKDEESLAKLNIVIDEVLRLEDLLEELREFYPQRALSIEEMDIQGLLREVFLLVKPDCDRKNIKADFRIHKGPLMIQGDRGKLKQVFLNIAKNALEAMEKGGTLSVRSKLSGELVEITLADDGCGIPEANLEKVFSPFFTTKKQGTGLGLGISKRIIEDHAGSSLTVKSQEGKGTLFKVTMPVHRM